MKTITIQIGNTDNKLTQQEFAEFVSTIDELIYTFHFEMHFKGGPPTWTRWQNVAWIIQPTKDCYDFEIFCADLNRIRLHYKQDSVALTIGETHFI